MEQEEFGKPPKPLIKTRWKDLLKGWAGRSVLLPFAVTRLLWLAVGLFSKNFAANPTYEVYSSRGWMLSPHFLIDIFTRWDAKWYLSIVENGYTPPADLSSMISNIAFFPLYPYLVRLSNLLLPGFLHSRSVTLLIGLAISNISFLIAAGLLYLFVRDVFESPKLAQRTLLLYFVFPTSYYFSAFYTESLFMLLALASFLMAHKKRWLPAGLFASLLALTRIQGILIILPLFILYLQDKNWNFKKIRADVLALAAPMGFLLTFSLSIDRLTGQPLALIRAQQAWGKFPGSIFEKIWIEIGAPVLDVFKFDFFFLLIFLITAVLLMIKPKTFAYGLFVFLIVFTPLASGSVISVSRYCLPCFPVFIFWADKLKNEQTFSIVKASLFTFQVLFFLAWSNYYWIA